MQLERIDKTLATAFLADVDQEAYSQDARRYGINAAVKEYSRYKPLLRRYGTGEVYDDVIVGATTALLLGGPYTIGATVALDSNTPNIETFRITDVEVSEDHPSWQAGSPVLVTLSAAITKLHRRGAQVANSPLGMQLIAGVDTYILPTDFISPVPADFDIAVGAKLTYTRQEGFFDAAYSIAKKFGQGGFGTTQNYGPSLSYLNGPNPNGFPGGSGPQSGTAEVVYRFIESDPGILVITPAPVANATLSFFYNAQRTLASIRDSEETLLCHYARYVLLTGQGAILGGLLDYSEDDVHETGTANANALQKLAADSLDEWNKMFRNRPYVTSG